VAFAGRNRHFHPPALVGQTKIHYCICRMSAADYGSPAPIDVSPYAK